MTIEQRDHTDIAMEVFYQRKKFVAHATPMTGAQLRALFAVPPTDLLYRSEGNKTEGNPIGSDESVPLKNGLHFVSIPEHITGGAVDRAVALTPRVQREVDRIEDEISPVELKTEGAQVFLLVAVASEGWTTDEVRTLVRVPAQYADEKPDLIFLEAGARWPGGPTPRLMQLVQLCGEQWQQISWHWSGPYDANEDNLVAFVRSIRKYLRAPTA